MRIQLLTGWTLVVVYLGIDYSEMCAPQSRVSLRLEADDHPIIQSCTQLPNGSYTKDLAVVEQDLARVCLVDNSPISYRINEGEIHCGVIFRTAQLSAANGIPIEGWTHDPSDEALLDLLPVLDSLRFTSDVRRVLGIRGNTYFHTSYASSYVP